MVSSSCRTPYSVSMLIAYDYIYMIYVYNIYIYILHDHILSMNKPMQHDVRLEDKTQTTSNFKLKTSCTPREADDFDVQIPQL